MATPTSRHPSSTPKKSPRTDPTDTTDDTDSVSWNIKACILRAQPQTKRLPAPHRARCSQLDSFWTRGYYVNSRGKKLVYNDKHLLDIMATPDRTFTFEAPSPGLDHWKMTPTEAVAVKLQLGTIARPLRAKTSGESADKYSRMRQRLPDMQQRLPQRRSARRSCAINSSRPPMTWRTWNAAAVSRSRCSSEALLRHA